MRDHVRSTGSPRRAAGSLAVLCALLAALPAGPAAAANKHKHKPARCRIAGRNLADSKLIKVAAGKDHDGEMVLRGCVRPTGRVFTLGVAPDEGLGDSSVSLKSVAGTWVVISDEGNNQYGGEGSVSVVNVRTGHGHTVFSSSYTIGEPGPYSSLDTLLIDRFGRAAAAEHVVGSKGPDNPTESEQIEAFAPGGTGLVLDSGDAKTVPAASLSFHAGVIGWTHGSEHRSVHFR